MKKNLKSWTIRWNNGEIHYEHVVATNVFVACNWCVKNTECESVDQIEYVSGDNVAIAEEE